MPLSIEEQQNVNDVVAALEGFLFGSADAQALFNLDLYSKAQTLIPHKEAKEVKAHPYLYDYLTILTFTPYTSICGFPLSHTRDQLSVIMPERDAFGTGFREFERESEALQAAFNTALQAITGNVYDPHPFFGKPLLSFRLGRMHDFLRRLATLSFLSAHSRNPETNEACFFQTFFDNLSLYLSSVGQHISVENEKKGRQLQPVLIAWTLCFTHSLGLTHGLRLTLPYSNQGVIETSASVYTLQTPTKSAKFAEINQAKADARRARETEAREAEIRETEARQAPRFIIEEAIRALEGIHTTTGKTTDISYTILELNNMKDQSLKELKTSLPTILRNIGCRIRDNFSHHRHHVVCGLIIAAGYLLVIPGIVFSVMASKRQGFFKALGDKRKKPRSEVAARRAVSILKQINLAQNNANSCRSAAGSAIELSTPRSVASAH